MIRQALILIAVITGVKSTEECHRFDPIKQCMLIDNAQSIIPLISIGEFPDEDFMNNHCSTAIQTVECIRDATEKCPEIGSQYFPPLSALEQVLSYLHSMCDEDSELKKRYLENVECYHSLSPQMEKCENNSRETMKDFLESVRNETSEEDRPYINCILMDLHLSCVLLEATEACGANGASPLATIGLQLSSVYKDTDCPDEDKRADMEARFILHIAEKALSEYKR